MIENGTFSRRRGQVLSIFIEDPEKLRTGEEVSKIFRSRFNVGTYSENVRNRITELVDMGVIGEYGTKDGVLLFGLTGNHPRPLIKKETSKEKIKSLEIKLEKSLSSLRYLWPQLNQIQKEKVKELMR